MSELALVAQEFEDAVIAANARLDRRFGEAMNGRDIEAVMNCFTSSPNLVVVLWGNILRGPDAVREFFVRLFSGTRTIQGQVNEIRRWQVGETVFAAGIATYELEALDGSRSTLKECWTDARQRASGRWVYVLDHAERLP